ncbi:MAG: nicotinamide riboside transporter PnuC [Hyphomonadaceae bacterium]
MTDPLEIAATALTLVCVILAVKRSLWQFPTGILGTGLGFFVFWNAALYSSAVLQPVFIVVQIYGWWFWLRGDHSHAPRIRETPAILVAAVCLAAVGLAVLGAWALETWTPAQMALWDAIILALSIVAQIMLSLKRIENWAVWVVVNALSVYVYGSQGLWLYTGLYAFFFFNAFWGWWEWRKELRSYSTVPDPAGAQGAA